MIDKSIQVFVINLKNRKDRRRHILSQFNKRNEFQAHIVEARENSTGAIGLWNTIRHILKYLAPKKSEFIILCEDDHQFTPTYSKEHLFACIDEAKTWNADILSGGISGFTNALQTTKNLFWVEKFSGLQFTVIFKNIFKRILAAEFCPGDAADYKFCSLTDNKFFIYPVISIQKDFGYSDATPKNNGNGQVEKLFKDCNEKVQVLQSVNTHYNKAIANLQSSFTALNWEAITIPTYIIHLPERTDRLKHITQQFKRRKEFDIRIIEACRHQIGTVGLWLSIRKVIELAIENDDDVIVLCEDDHEFTRTYCRDAFLSSLMQSHQMGCNILSGGIGYYNMAVPLTEKLYWIDSFWCTQFLVVFKRFFKAILNEPFEDMDTADGKFSEMTSQKMVIHPFISVQKDFGYSDVTLKNDKMHGLITSYFEDTDKKLKKLRDISNRFKLKTIEI